MLLSCSNGDGNPVLLGLLGGVVGGVLTRILHDWHKTHQRVKRLKSTLLVECVATLNRFDDVRRDIEVEVETVPAELSVNAARKFLGGIVLSPPLDAPKELLTLLPPEESRNIVHFYDRWARFLNQEVRYNAMYQKLLEAAVKHEGNEEGAGDAFLEYWEIVHGLLLQMRQQSKELCYFACLLLREFGPTDDHGLSTLCSGRWANWQEWGQERLTYE